MDEDGFIRQRRNLIVVSLVLLLVQGTGLRVTEISVLGNRAELGRAFDVEPVLWVAWVYLFVRYWQAFQEKKGPKFLEVFRGEMHNLLYQRVSARLGTAKVPGLGSDGVVESSGISRVEKPTWSKAVFRVEARCTFGAVNPYGVKRAEVIQFDYAVDANELWGLRVEVLVRLGLNTLILTELYLPLAVGLTPLAAVIRGT